MSRLGKEMINCSHPDDRQRAVGIQLPAASLKPPDVESGQLASTPLLIRGPLQYL